MSSGHPHERATSLGITIADIPGSLKAYRTNSSVRKPSKTANRKDGRLLRRSERDILHTKGIEHVAQNGLFVRGQIAFGLVFQDGQEVDDFFGLR